MPPIHIPGIDKPISPFALGTAFYRIDDSEHCFALLDAYVASGGTVIDSARSYGQSEDVLGHWFEARPDVRDRILLITKCGHGPELKLPEQNFAACVQEELAASLDTLRTEVIDLYVLHRDNQEMPVSTILEALQPAIVSGQVQALGASNWEYRRVIEAKGYADKHELTGFSIVSNTLSLAQPAAAFYTGLVHADPIGERWHQETGVPLLPWSSQARGFFTGVVTREMGDEPSIAEPEQPTFTSRMLKVYGTDDNFARLERAKTLGERKGGYSAIEVALAWLTHKPFPVIPVVGPRTTDELKSCQRALTLTLPADEIRWLEEG